MKFFKAAIIGIAAMTSLNVSANQCKFSAEQTEVLRNAWFAGADRDYGWTLAAIAWKESSAGENLVNWRGPAFGPFQNLLKTVAARNNVKTQKGQVQLMNRLITDFDYAAEQAMTELDYWKMRHRGNWNLMVQSYFGGNTPNTPAAISYRADVVKKIQFLRKNGCIFNE